MSHLFFNFQQFASQILQCEHEEETEELLMSLKEYIENMLEYVHELELEKGGYQDQVLSLQSRVDDLEAELY